MVSRAGCLPGLIISHVPFFRFFCYALKAAGFSDRQLVEIPLVVGVILLTNMVNRINDTTLDFPKAA